jgi:hypothetical protein
MAGWHTNTENAEQVVTLLQLLQLFLRETLIIYWTLKCLDTGFLRSGMPTCQIWILLGNRRRRGEPGNCHAPGMPDRPNLVGIRTTLHSNVWTGHDSRYSSHILSCFPLVTNTKYSRNLNDCGCAVTINVLQCSL